MVDFYKLLSRLIHEQDAVLSRIIDVCVRKVRDAKSLCHLSVSFQLYKIRKHGFVL